MKKHKALLETLTTFVLLLPCITPVCARASNRVSVQLNQVYGYFTEEDSIDNTPLVWDYKWHPLIHNVLDDGGPVVNPKVVLETDLELVRFDPDDPSVFTAQPPLYTWYFDGLEVEEPALLPIHAWMAEPLTAQPRFTASRSVEPEILSQATTFQTIKLNFRLEESLPPQVNWLMISIGSPVIAYEGFQLVEGSFVSQNSVGDWDAGNDGVQAWWVADFPNVDVGKTYTLQATLKAEKSSDLLGSPTFKPGVCIQYAQMIDQLSIITAKTVTITHPESIITATFTADNEVDWDPVFRYSHFTFWFLPIVSEVTPPPPPFYVLIPADVTIKPETLELSSRGVITAFIELPEQYSVEDIDLETVKCQGAAAKSGAVEDDILKVKFNRQDLQDVVPGKEVELQVAGETTDGTRFEGTDTIRVID